MAWRECRFRQRDASGDRVPVADAVAVTPASPCAKASLAANHRRPHSSRNFAAGPKRDRMSSGQAKLRFVSCALKRSPSRYWLGAFEASGTRCHIDRRVDDTAAFRPGPKTNPCSLPPEPRKMPGHQLVYRLAGDDVVEILATNLPT